MNILPGKKTYISAFILFLFGVYQVANGDIVGGAQRIAEAAALAGLRSGVSTEAARN